MNAFVDIHCHPLSKPFAKSQPLSHPAPNIRNKSNLWYHDPPTLTDKLANFLLTLTKFRQTDLTASALGNVRVIVNSLYPLERGFCRNKLGQALPSDAAVDLATSFGRLYIDRVQAIHSADDYYSELTEQYAFLREHDGRIVTLSGGQRATYRLIRNYTDLEQVLKSDTSGVLNLAMMLSIEGAHVFGSGIDNNADQGRMLARVADVKAWPHRPLFITFAHHFYNELCGHAESLTGILSQLIDQHTGMNQGFSPLGETILKALLTTGNGPRILIDIKHMSVASRTRYFTLLDTEFAGELIPVIVSHGCVRGNDADRQRFHDHPINFSDDEILRVARSGGLFGIQLDERRIGSTSALQHARGHINRRDILYKWAELVWFQIEYIASLLDAHNLFAWGTACLGTDYDGIVNPVNGYWTHREFPELDAFLLMHAHNYVQKKTEFRNPENRIHEDKIIARFMGTNALDFFRKHYH